MSSEKIVGVVSWFSDTHGYGFIIHEDVQYFVHHTQIRMDGFRTVERGSEVKFFACSGPKGPFASDVEVLCS